MACNLVVCIRKHSASVLGKHITVYYETDASELNIWLKCQVVSEERVPAVMWCSDSVRHVSGSLPASMIWVKIISLTASPVECLEVKALLCLPKTGLYTSVCKWWRCSSPDREGGFPTGCSQFEFLCRINSFLAGSNAPQHCQLGIWKVSFDTSIASHGFSKWHQWGETSNACLDGFANVSSSSHAAAKSLRLLSVCYTAPAT